MTDCPECAKKLLNAAEQLMNIVGDDSGSFADATRLRAQHYIDALAIVCPDKAREIHKR